MKLQQPDLKVEYFNDELGNTYATLVDTKTGAVETLELGRLNAAQKWAIEALNAPVMSGYGGTSGGGYGGAYGGAVAGTTVETGVAGETIDPVVAAAQALLAQGETVGTVGSSIQSGGELASALTAGGFSMADQIAIAQAMYELTPLKSGSYYQGQAAGKALLEPMVPYAKGLAKGATNIYQGLQGFFGF